MDATVLHYAYTEDSVIGRAVNFGVGTKIANLRHDDAPVKVTVKRKSVDTGRRKFGILSADGVKTVINTTINLGVKLGPI
jgi:bifunctional UDP-N-acetylglucosamine pyrophosphorylase/glucosamine-1-phosphate N-acetyltransferase